MLVRVTIQSDKLSIAIDRSSLVTGTPDSLGAQAPSKPITLTVPYEIARRGRQVRLVITGSASAEQAPIPSLIRAVAMARDWAARIAAGEIFELNELAREYGIERSYAQKVLRCVALSPQHVEAILSGQHDAGLTFTAATANIPLQWQLQDLGSRI